LVEIHRSLEDVLLAVDNNLSGIEPGLSAVEFQGAGISHHSPLVKDRMPGMPGMVMRMSDVGNREHIFLKLGDVGDFM